MGQIQFFVILFLVILFTTLSATASPMEASTKPITVAIFDTGIETAHPYFQDHLWVNAGEIEDNGIDDDGNGYIDDIHGVNFRDQNGDIFDDSINGHGTHMAGLVLGAHLTDHPRLPITVMVLKYDPYRIGRSLLQALNYAEAAGVNIINISISVHKYERYTTEDLFLLSSSQKEKVKNDIVKFYKQQIDLSEDKNFEIWFMRYQNQYWNEWNMAISKIKQLQYKTLIVAAAGNYDENIDETHIEPAALPYQNVLTVMNITQLTQRFMGQYGSSNYGQNSVQVSATGEDVYSTTAYHVSDTGFQRMTGTSQSAAKITYETVRLLSELEKRSAITPRKMKQILLESLPASENLTDLTLTGKYLPE